VKVRWDGDAVIGASPEYDACASAADRAGVPVRVVYEAAVVAAGELLGRLAAASDEDRGSA